MARPPQLFFFALAVASAIASEPPDPSQRIAPNDPAWRDLTADFSRKPDGTADFSEQRFFPFRNAPLELKGEVRVSTKHGLSLHYTIPDERTVIIDDQGMLVRQASGENAAPSDPRANAANAALVQVLHFDLTALATNFEIFGRRDGPAWSLTLVPRGEDLRRAVGEIVVAGEAAAVHRIAIRRTAKQYIEILVGPARTVPFTADELKRFFR